MGPFPVIWFGSLSLAYAGLALWNVYLGRAGWIVFDAVFACIMASLCLYHFKRLAPHA